MMKRFLALAAMAMVTVAVNAQDCPLKCDNTPKKNDFTAAVTLEYNSYGNITAQSAMQTNYAASAVSENWTEKQLMVGLEFGWFMNKNWKLELGGGFNFKNNPGYIGTEAYPNEPEYANPSEGDIADYGNVDERSNFNFRVFVGADRYFRINSIKNLACYVGLRCNYTYGQDRMRENNENAMGRSLAEMFSIGGSVQLGIDYFVFKGLYLGASIAPVAYSYNCVSYVPQEGLSTLRADGNNISAFAAPTLKVGFKFGK